MRKWLAAAWLALAFAGACAAAGSGAQAAGEAIYRRGVLPSGELLQSERNPGLRTEGSAAACVNCHRRSGLGMQEGRRIIPPIAGRYLFHPRAKAGDGLDLPLVAGMRPDRDPYDEVTLARAIRQGVGNDGKALNVLMPRFDLDDAAMADLIAYLRTLAPVAVPGVQDSVLHFATIFTPDSDPAARQGVLDVLKEFFADKNHYTRAESPRLRSSRRVEFKVNRHWELHVWQLKGAPETWEAQLRSELAAQPVFAVISGVGGRTWAPVHRFCEAEAVPCLFPNVDLPVDSENDLDDVYFSKGVLLEAQLIAKELESRREEVKFRRIVQVFRENDVGGSAAAALSSAVTERDTGILAVERQLSVTAGRQELMEALRNLNADDALVLWLRPDDVAALGKVPARVSSVYISGRMGGLELAPLPPAWREVAHMAYPFNLPDRRRVQVDYPLGWFRIRHIPVVAAQAQADTYLACIILADTINHMSDTFQRDYLLERMEEGLEHRS